MNRDAQGLRKCLKPLEISRSEIAVQKIVLVLQNKFADSFNGELEKEKLTVGCPIGDTAADCLLSYERRGKVMMNDFKTRITSSHVSEKKQFDPKNLTVFEYFIEFCNNDRKS